MVLYLTVTVVAESYKETTSHGYQYQLMKKKSNNNKIKNARGPVICCFEIIIIK